MSDTPLFQHSDEQEAVYGGTPTTDRDHQTGMDASSPGAAAPSVLGYGGAGGIAGTPGIVPPAAASEITDDADDTLDSSSRA